MTFLAFVAPKIPFVAPKLPNPYSVLNAIKVITATTLTQMAFVAAKPPTTLTQMAFVAPKGGLLDLTTL